MTEFSWDLPNGLINVSSTLTMAIQAGTHITADIGTFGWSFLRLFGL